MALVGTITVKRLQDGQVVATSQERANVIKVTQVIRKFGGDNVLVSPFNQDTKIVFDVDGGMTITSPVRITIINQTTGDGVIY